MVCKLVIKISQETKNRLDELKEHKRETYNDVVERISKKELNNDCENGRNRREQKKHF